RLATKSKLNFQFICCPSGHQSVDKHLIADVAMAAAINPLRDYIIVTNDKGYMSPIGRVSEKTHSNIQLRNAVNEEDDNDEHD
ncbi:MAG: hypothetical protein K2F99_03435, partial [Muribaculaceae bacterium]|nr:hypothetical protein [Muribaculaceae bacterium]